MPQFCLFSWLQYMYEMKKGGEINMKRKLILILAVVAVLTVSFTVFALASDTPAAQNIRWFFGIDTSKLTDQQKADMNDSISKMTEQQKENAQKMADLQKEAIDKMVANGAMTKEQGDAAKAKIDEQLKNMEQNRLGKGFGLGMGKGDFGFPGMSGMDLSKLTDEQKSALKETFTNMADLQKEAINKLVMDGAITKEQGDAAAKAIDNMVQNFDTKGLQFEMVLGRGCFIPWEVKGFNTSKFTDEQKAVLKDYSTQIANLQKDAVNKLVADGVMTKEQGDAAIKRIDDMVNNIGTGNFLKGGGMQGQFRDKGLKGGPWGNSGTSSIQ